jgi:hypothetical protein
MEGVECDHDRIPCKGLTNCQLPLFLSFCCIPVASKAKGHLPVH